MAAAWASLGLVAAGAVAIPVGVGLMDRGPDRLADLLARGGVAAAGAGAGLAIAVVVVLAVTR